VLRHKLGLYGMLPNTQKKSPDAYRETGVVRGGDAGKADPNNLYRLT